MKRDIIVGKDFRTYVKSPLIADDTMAYNIIWDLGVPCENSEFLITAFREDGQIVTDTGTIDENGKASYTLANNMYCIEGQAEIRLSILTNTTTLTDKILIFDVLSPNNINAIEGNTDEQLINTLMAKFNEATNKLNNIPSKTSDLENDSDFTTKAYVDEVVPTKTSQLTNDSDFATKSYVDDAVPKYTWDDIMSVLFESLPTKVSQLDNDSGYINDITLYDSINSALSGCIKDENYVHTDNNFTDAVSEFCWDMIGIFGGNAFSVASQNYVKSYVDEKLGVIENGSY